MQWTELFWCACTLLKSLWKHHKSKDLKFLHRKCKQKILGGPKKISKFLMLKKKFIFFGPFFFQNRKIKKKSIFNFETQKSKKSGNFSVPPKIWFFFNIDFLENFSVPQFFWVQLRCKIGWSFDLWGFQSDSGSPSWILAAINVPVQEKTHFSYDLLPCTGKNALFLWFATIQKKSAMWTRTCRLMDGGWTSVSPTFSFKITF